MIVGIVVRCRLAVGRATVNMVTCLFSIVASFEKAVNARGRDSETGFPLKAGEGQTNDQEGRGGGTGLLRRLFCGIGTGVREMRRCARSVLLQKEVFNRAVWTSAQNLISG